jgi:soluble P-type ATPase
MFSYQQTFFKPTEVVTEQLFYDLVRAPYTAELIDSIRLHKAEAERLTAEGNASEAKQHEQEAAKLKKKLPAFMFQATFDETMSKKGIMGCWRKQAAARLTGLVVMDIDHVDNPVETFKSWGMAPLSSPEGDTLHLGSGSSPRGGWEGAIVLVYITPSGKGLKVVFKADASKGNLIDNQHWMAKELGVDEFHAELLPHHKVERVEELLAQTGGTLVFVGDGINDAPVLTRSDIGIAMGALGSDAAIEAADIVLMDDKPSKIAAAIRISRKTLRIVRQNIVFALGVKFGVLILGALGMASMWMAVFADVGVAFLAILNAMRCLNTGDLL